MNLMLNIQTTFITIVISISLRENNNVHMNLIINTRNILQKQSHCLMSSCSHEQLDDYSYYSHSVSVILSNYIQLSITSCHSSLNLSTSSVSVDDLIQMS